MTKRVVHCLALVLAAASTAGQSSIATNPGPAETVAALGAPARAEARPAAGAADTALPKRLSDDTYKLMPGDKLSFQIEEDREPIKSLIVTDSGDLDVPYIGRVSAAGKTCKQLGEEIKALLEKDYYYRATVMIGLDQVSRTVGRVYVWGQVRNQGAVEIPPAENFTVGKAILRAGGFADFANKKKVKLVRNTPTGDKQTIELNMEEILQQGKIEQDVAVKPDDFIIVPARLVNW